MYTRDNLHSLRMKSILLYRCAIIFYQYLLLRRSYESIVLHIIFGMTRHHRTRPYVYNYFWQDLTNKMIYTLFNNFNFVF
jgi:hypothetical protein